KGKDKDKEKGDPIPAKRPVPVPLERPDSLPELKLPTQDKQDNEKPIVMPKAPTERQPAQNAPAQVNPEDRQIESRVGPTEKNPTGRQEPAVSLEWIGPITAKVGVAQDYSIVVRNACNIAVQQVMVRARVPNSMTVSATEPKGVSQDNVYMWELGTL